MKNKLDEKDDIDVTPIETTTTHSGTEEKQEQSAEKTVPGKIDKITAEEDQEIP